MYASADDQNAPLLNSNMFSLSGAKFFGAISRSINLGIHIFFLCLNI